MKIKEKIQALGPGLLFAGAAIGVSHLVQSTRAGADFGFTLLWALIIVHLVKYPFFQFGARYTNATGESLLHGYKNLHKGTLIAYFIINFASMFTIQAAVTLVTAGLAMNIFGYKGNATTVCIIITVISSIILLVGHYKLLDKVMKIVIITLTVTTLGALFIAFNKNTESFNIAQKLTFNGAEIAFLIAFLGWMPAPLDVSIWQSLWCYEKQIQEKDSRSLKTTLFDFNIGYIATLVLGLCFLSMGALVMYHSGEKFANGALGFSKQLINMYTANIGGAAFIFIAIAAFTTMFSTTITALDASPRAMETTLELLKGKKHTYAYAAWIFFLALGTILIVSFFKAHMLQLVKIATILSFLTAPFFAVLNYILITSKHTPESHKPSILLKILSWLGITFLIGFSIWYLATLF
ncbi:Nramp family divalent metal transporter [Wenyingzhuangia sp. IMCC45574]